MQEVQRTVEMMVEMQRLTKIRSKQDTMLKASIFTTSVFQATSGTSLVLPANWEERMDFNGKVYFLNQTGESVCNVNIIVNTRELQFSSRVKR